MKKTISEVAKELAVTKQTINYHLKSLSPKKWQKSDKGIILINASGIKDLRQKIGAKQVTNNHQKKDIEKVLIEQLNQKDKQIDELQKLLDQQQKLSLINANKIEVLELELKEQKTKRKKWFWQK